MLKKCDRCERVSQYEEQCEREGGTFYEVPSCILEVIEGGRLVCLDCRTEYEPVPDGMRLLKACRGAK